MFLSCLFGKKPDDATAHRLYVVLAAQARLPAFYSKCGIPDTLDGRFDMLTLHMFLVLRRLSGPEIGGALAGLAQQLFDVMFGDMDQSLREMGVGDLTVGKRIRAMSEAFYGRVEAYEAGLQATDGNATLVLALERNLYRGNPPVRAILDDMASYMRTTAELLEEQSADDFLAGKLSFALPPRYS